MGDSSGLSVVEFLGRRVHTPVIDVRSPAEFEQGRMRHAHNLPLFSNEERARVGTTYKESGRDAATLLGLGIVGPQLETFARAACAIAGSAGSSEVLVHCWRGGMRSASVAWLCRTAGLEVATLEGGYKAYRRYVLEMLAEPRPTVIIGGKTGAGKTDLLHLLRAAGEQILDLESLAHHRGSSFGALGYAEQPTNEQFENDIAEEWSGLDLHNRVWLEDESQKVGRNFIVDPFYERMKTAPLILVEVPLEERVQRLVQEYGRFGVDALREATVRIGKRLGGERTARAVSAIEAGDLATAVQLVLDYYDRAYTYGVEKKHIGPIVRLQLQDGGAESVARILEVAADLEGSLPSRKVRGVGGR